MGARIQDCFSRLAASGRKALIPFFTAGFPAHDSTVPVMHAVAAAGADIIELGVPFSDPMADGPAIQRSSERALANGVGLRDVLEDGVNGWSCPVNDEAAWVRALERAMDDRPGLRRRQAASLQIAAKFDLPGIVDAYERALAAAVRR